MSKCTVKRYACILEEPKQLIVYSKWNTIYDSSKQISLDPTKYIFCSMFIK